jgi:hypothetical protein
LNAAVQKSTSYLRGHTFKNDKDIVMRDEIDQELNFHDDSEILPPLTGVVTTLGVSQDIRDQANSAYDLGVKKNLHHKVEYAPCTCYDADGNIIGKSRDCCK